MVDIIFEDDFLLVVNKPSGLVTTASFSQKEPALEDLLRDERGLSLERAGITHRLDKDTSGLLIVAKTVKVFEDLQAQFKGRIVKKEYLALAHGLVGERGRIDMPIARNPGIHDKFVSVDNDDELEGREAVTEYEPVRNFKFGISNLKLIFKDLNKTQMKKIEVSNYDSFTLLKCHPLTGRTHQIRVHLKYQGFPIVGDEKYAGRKIIRWDRMWCPRQFLHAARLEFTHPVTGKKISFESPLPEDLEQVLGLLVSQPYARI